MLLSTKELIHLLRTSVNVQVPSDEGSDTTIDPNYLALTDEDLLLYMKLGVTRAFPEVQEPDLSDLPDGSQFAVVLLAKIELYTALAVMKGDKVDMGVDNNTYLKQSQKFDHYMKLAADAREQYDDWMENEGEELLGIGVVNTYNVLLDKRHYSPRNRELQKAPKVKVKVNNVTADTVEFSWSVTGIEHFARYKVYVSDSLIIDLFADGANYENKISKDAKCVKTTSNLRDNTHRITGLSPATDYHIAVVSVERNAVFGCSEVLFTTLEEPEDEEDSSTEEYTP